jgi:CheY-specific phosphatase CheX
MGMLQQVDKTWKAIGIIIGIVAGSIVGWTFTMAQAAEVAKKEVQATVNKEMIDGAKKAAADAVKEITPDIAKIVAQEMIKQQREADEKKKVAVKP